MLEKIKEPSIDTNYVIENMWVGSKDYSSIEPFVDDLKYIDIKEKERNYIALFSDDGELESSEISITDKYDLKRSEMWRKLKNVCKSSINNENIYSKSCPFCGLSYRTKDKANNKQNDSRTLEHILPKDQYVHYIISPCNLIYCCGRCNRIKGNKYLKKDTFHPYYCSWSGSIEDVQLKKLEKSKIGIDYNFEFTGTDKRVKKHFVEIFDFNGKYKEFTNSFLEDLKNNIISMFESMKYSDSDITVLVHQLVQWNLDDINNKYFTHDEKYLLKKFIQYIKESEIYERIEEEIKKELLKSF